jgi:hypothetical protein
VVEPLTNNEIMKIMVIRMTIIIIIQFNSSIQFNSILYYLCAESTATRPITVTAQGRYR